MKAYWRVEVQLYLFIILALHGDEQWASCPSCFNTMERLRRINCIRRLGGPQGETGRLGEEKHLFPCQESDDDSSISQPVTQSLY
jgi:hypothetical protein